MHEHHVKTLSLFFVCGWLSTITCQMAPAPFGFENFLFSGLGTFPPYLPPPLPPPPQPIGMSLFGIENLLGQAQFAAPPIGMPPVGGGYSMGPLPFPLFPMPCDMICNHGGLFFANIAITNPQQQAARPGGAAGMPGAGGAMPGGIPGAGGLPTTMRPGGAAGAGGTGGAGGAAARPGAAGGVGGAGGAGGAAAATRPPTAGGAGGMPTTMPTRTPQMGGAGMIGQQNPSINAQIMYYHPNWCTGWCRFFYRPRPMMLPPPPPPPLALPHPACLIFSWLGL